MKRPILVASFLGAAALVLAACNGGDSSAGIDADRTVEIDMVDIAFEPDSVEVSTGETVRFVFTNKGEAVHDAFIGDGPAQMDHEMEMRERGDGDHGNEGGHGGGDRMMEAAITVDPGEQGELVYTFDEPGSLEIGCHQEGHYEAGMVVNVTVK